MPREPRSIFNRAANTDALARTWQRRLNTARRSEATYQIKRINCIAPWPHQARRQGGDHIARASDRSAQARARPLPNVLPITGIVSNLEIADT
jgi:hypothetical protein